MLAQYLWSLKCFVSGVEDSTDADTADNDHGNQTGRNTVEEERFDAIFNFDGRVESEMAPGDPRGQELI